MSKGNESMRIARTKYDRMKEPVIEKMTSNFCPSSFNTRKWSLALLLTLIISSHLVCCSTAVPTSTFISSSLHSSLKIKSRIKPVSHICDETSTRASLRTNSAPSVTYKTALFAKNKKEEMENKKDGVDSASTNKESKKNGKKRNFMKRIFNKDKDSSSSSSIDEKDNDNNNNNKGILGVVGKVLKRSPNEIQEKETSTSSSIIDPSFKSEIALRAELKRQVALDKYEAGDEIPKEFLPLALLLFEAALMNDYDDDKLPPFELDKIIASLDESIFYVYKSHTVIK